MNPNADADGDGMSNKEEYLAGTNPTNSSDNLRITAFTISPGGTNVSPTWSSVPTRNYLIQKTTNIASQVWLDSGAGVISAAGPSTTHALIDTFVPNRFYRVEAVRPLAPQSWNRLDHSASVPGPE